MEGRTLLGGSPCVFGRKLVLWPDRRDFTSCSATKFMNSFFGHNLRARCLAWIRGDSSCASKPLVKMKKAIAKLSLMLIPARFGKAACHGLAICFGLSLVAGRLFAAYTPPTALVVPWMGLDQSSTCHKYDDYITNVTFAGINNTTPVGTPGWHFDYGRTTPQVAPGTVTAGQSYPISITVTGQDLSYHYVAVYIDWNQNNVNGTTAYPYILDANENPVVWSNYTGLGSKTLTGTITVPAGVSSGNIYMRVMLDADSGGSNGGDYTCAIGCGEFEDYVLTVVATVTAPTVTTTAPSVIAATSATLGGNVTADGGATVSARGVVYSATDSTPTIAEGATQVAIGSGTGSFSQSVGSLAPGTTYYVNAYATNSGGTRYGTATSFTTSALAPTLTKPTISNLGANQVTFTFQSSATGTGYFTLLTASETAGTPAQTAAGKNASGTTAYRQGSLKLTAAANGTYTVSNLSAATHYTVCFTADDGSALAGVDASVSFTTNASTTLTGMDWTAVGTAGFSTGAADYTSLAFAPDGTPYIGFLDAANSNKITVMKCSGGIWTLVGTAGFSPAAGDESNLAISPSGTPYVVYRDTATFKPTVMQYTGLGATGWELVGATGFSAGYSQYYSRLVFAPDGTPYLAYRDTNYGGKATVMKFDGNAWVVVGTAGFSADTANDKSMAIAPDGTPYIAYQDFFGGVGEVTVMKFTSGVWSLVGAVRFSAGTGAAESLKFAPDGTLYVAYEDFGNGSRATVMKFNGTAWVVVGTPGFSADSAGFTSLTFTPDGTPYVAYEDGANSTKATVMKFNGATWETVGTAGFSGAEAMHTSLAIAPDGTPLVAYKDGSKSYHATVMKLAVPAPTVSAVAPTTGTTLGGTSVTITGTHFTGTTAVKFGTTNATTFTVNSATQITATAPAHAGGVVDITVTTGGGTSATSASDQFTYINAPTSLIVSSNGDSGLGSLREAIATIGNGGKITFDPSLAGQAILLASPLKITHDFTIDGSALVPHVRISGNHVTIVFNVASGVTASLIDLDLVDGYTTAGSSAGCINNQGVLTLRNCVLTGNDGILGSILNLFGTLTMQSCTLSGNRNDRGVIYNAGPLVMESCTLSGNTGGTYAGGLMNVNIATLTNCTIAGNLCNGTASDMGGGAILQSNGTVTLNHCTIVGNRAAKGATSGLFITNGMLKLNNSIVANNGTGGLENFSVSGGTFTSQGYNISNAWNGRATTTGDRAGDPLLAALADNGGPTQTCALQAGSPALNAANPTDPTATDQRGVSRPQVGRSDIGAFEAVVGVAAIDVPSNGIYAAGQALDFTVHFNSAVTVDRSSGTPRIALNIGGNTVYADYASGSGTADLVFHYTVQAGDVDTDGIAVGSAIDLNGGTILSTVGSNLVALILPGVGSTSGVHVATPPTLTKPTISNLGANQVTFTFRSSATGTGYFTLLIDSETAGTAAQTAVGQNASGTNAYRHGSLPLTVAADGTYTVTNLTENTHYTVCFTAENGGALAAVDASVSFMTATATNLNALDWTAAGPAGFSGGVADYTNLAFAPNGMLYIAYADAASSNKATVMRFNGMEWSVVGAAGFSAGPAPYTKLVFAPDGTPYVAFNDGAKAGKATVMKFDGMTWTAVGDEGFSTENATQMSLAFAPDGTPYVAYTDQSGIGQARVMKFDGTAWTVVGTAGVSPLSAGFTSLAFAPDGTPYVAYQDVSNGYKASVARYNGAAWVPVGPADFSTDSVAYTNLAFAPDGTPYVAYADASDSHKATVLKFDGTAWTVVGTPCFSAGTADYATFAIAGDGTPCIAYRATNNGNGATVMKFNGTAWTVVGTTGFSAGVADYTSLAFSPDGTPYVAYRDARNSYKATVMELGAVVTSVSVPTAGTYGLGLPLHFTVNFSGVVTITGAPKLAITIGSTVRDAVYTGGDGTSALTYQYVVQPGDTDTDGIAIGSSLTGGIFSGSPVLVGVGDTTGVLIDSTAPAAPTISTVTATKLGGTAEAGSQVFVYDGSTLLSTTIAGSDGKWSLTVTLLDGVHTLTATACDAGANFSSVSSAITPLIDTVAPVAPVVSTISAVTNNTTPTISGTAEAGSTVKIYDGSTLLGTTTTASDGTWSLLVTLTDGTHNLTATATDSVGNVGSASSAITPTIDTVAPSAPVFSNASGNTTVKTPTLAGTAEAGSTVKIYDGTTLLCTTTAAGGVWSFTLTTALTDGPHAIAAVATDAAGNTSTTSALALIVGTAPSITTAPVAQIVAAGSSANFTVSAAGTATLGYQWQKSTDNTTFAVIPTATTATYVVASATVAQTGYYRVVVTNQFGTATSASAFLTVTPAYTAPTSDGSAAAVTGGSGPGSQSVTVLNAADFRTYATSTTPYVITVIGTLNIGTVNVTSNKTIQGADGNAALLGNLTLGAGVSNVAIRGLNLTNPGTTIVNGAYTDGGDALTLSGASNVFVTHVTFFDCADHAIKIVNGSDNITVSWCEFYNTSSTLLHRTSVQIGTTTESKPLHVTLHHNWWAANLDTQMPLSSYGYVHQYNNYFASAGNASGTLVSDQSQLLSERNVYTGMVNPLTKQTVNAALTAGKVHVIGNVYTTCTGTAPDAGTDLVFTPSYSYEMLPTSDVAAEVSTLAGNTAGAGSIDAATGTATSAGPAAAVTPGTSFTLTSIAMGFTATTYQWRLNNVDVVGATASTYTCSNTQAAHVGTYTVAISMASGDTVISTPFVVTLGTPPKTGGSGGGSFDGWFCAALALLGSLHLHRRRIC